MSRRADAAGFTLVEVLVAMAVLLIGATGVAATFTQGQVFHGDARRMARATAIGQDLLAQVELWPYDDPTTASGPFRNSQAGNDDDLCDGDQAFETSTDPVADGIADHGESDLPSTFRGLPTSALGSDYQRFWNVAAVSSATGGVDAVRVTVVVRWRAGAAWRRLALHAAKPNPATVH